MKALTLTQPFATLVAIGAKHFETRSWSTDYRGPLAIHAAKGLTPVGGAAGLVQFYWREPFRQALAGAGFSAELDHELPRGAVVAVCDLVYCLPTGEVREDLTANALADIEGETELAFGDFSPGRYAWRLANVRMLDKTIACKGALGLWDVGAELAGLIDSALVVA
jgi:hypothetical protein